VGHLILYGLFMMLVIRFMPDGIWGRIHRLYTRVQARGVGHGAT
jgi:branched-chain amino acid transport system permease protein